MSCRTQLSFTVIHDRDVEVQDLLTEGEKAIADAGGVVEGRGYSDLNTEFDVIGIDEDGEPWEKTLRASSEDDARAAAPDTVKIAKVQAVSPFAANPTGEHHGS